MKNILKKFFPATLSLLLVGFFFSPVFAIAQSSPTISALYGLYGGKNISGKVYPDQPWYIEVSNAPDAFVSGVDVGSNFTYESSNFSVQGLSGKVLVKMPPYPAAELPEGTLAVRVFGRNGWSTPAVRVQFLGKAADVPDPVVVDPGTSGATRPRTVTDPNAPDATRPRVVGNQDVNSGLQTVRDLFGGTGDLVTSTTVGGVLRAVINGILALTIIVAVGMIVLGGFWYITSAGSKDRAEQGKRMIRYAVYGILLVVLAYTIVTSLVNFVQTF